MSKNKYAEKLRRNIEDLKLVLSSAIVKDEDDLARWLSEEKYGKLKHDEKMRKQIKLWLSSISLTVAALKFFRDMSDEFLEYTDSNVVRNFRDDCKKADDILRKVNYSANLVGLYPGREKIYAVEVEKTF